MDGKFPKRLPADRSESSLKMAKTTRSLHSSWQALPAWWAAVLLILLVSAWFSTNIPNVHMHPDEELSYRATRGSLADTIAFQTSVQDNQAPLWFVSFWGWQQLIGDHEFTSRMMGLLFGVLTLAVTYRLGRRWFGGALPALGAVALLGTNFYFFTYTLDIRPYPLALLSAALSMLTFDRLRARPSRTTLIAHGLTTALMLYVHYLLVFLLVVQALAALVMGIARRDGRHLAVFTGALIFGGLLWLPWMPIFFRQVAGLRAIETAAGTARGVAGIGVSTLPTRLETLSEWAGFASNDLIFLYAPLIAAGIFLVRRRAEYGLALGWALGVLAVALIGNLVAAVYAHRFVSHTVLGIALACGAALASLPRRWNIAACAAFVTVNLLVFPAQSDLRFPTRIPYRTIFQTMGEEARAGDALLMIRAGEDDPFMLWPTRHYLPPDLNANRVTVTEAQAARRVWLVTGDWFHDEVQAAFAQLETTHPVQQVIGQCDRAWCYLAQLMEAPPHAEPIPFGERMLFWGADVDDVTADEIRLRLWWRVEQPPERDYSIGVHLLDAQGALIAQHDGAIMHYGVETVQTSAMQPGRIYIDWRTIPLPDELPPGEYTLALVVYQPWDGVRLVLPDGADYLALQTVTVH